MKTQLHQTGIFPTSSSASAPDNSGRDADARVRSMLWFNGETADDGMSKPAEADTQLSAWENYIIAIAG